MRTIHIYPYLDINENHYHWRARIFTVQQKDDESGATIYTTTMYTHPILRLPFRVFYLLPVLIVLLSSPLARAAREPVGINYIPVCMNFSCRDRQFVAISLEEWNSVADWMRPAAPDAATERTNIKNAIGWMEVIVGRHTPTHRDLGGDLGDRKDAQFPGQLDCIDESFNTTAYLQLFQNNGLLKYHKVVDRAFRRSIRDQHWAGQIETLDSGKRWVVDSWFQRNGYLPYIQKSEEWEDINVLYTANVDSSQPKTQKEGSFFKRLLN
jgi:hypothetical protein